MIPVLIYEPKKIEDNKIILGYKGCTIDNIIVVCPPPPGPGYHIKKPEKGVYGEFSKIKEELQELEDALSQGAKIMALHELSDMIGAMKAFLEKYYDGFSLDDLEKMSDITQRAFLNGERT